jgi:opacity protein-like surface antigen
MLRHFRSITTLAVALVALAACVAPASAATPGTFSIGGNFGTGMYSNSDLNDILESGGYDKVNSGWEYGGSLRYQMSPRMALDLEGNFMKPAVTLNGTGGDPDIHVSTPGMAVPLNLYYQLSQNETTAFNLFGGAGIVTGAKAKQKQEGSPDFEVDGKSSFYGQAGLEAQYMVSQSFALGARALGRMAKSELEKSDPSDPTVEIDYSGFAFSLGARMSFGGGGSE